jgi:hypothetical protein
VEQIDTVTYPCANQAVEQIDTVTYPCANQAVELIDTVTYPCASSHRHSEAQHNRRRYFPGPNHTPAPETPVKIATSPRA